MGARKLQRIGALVAGTAVVAAGALGVAPPASADTLPAITLGPGTGLAAWEAKGTGFAANVELSVALTKYPTTTLYRSTKLTTTSFGTFTKTGFGSRELTCGTTYVFRARTTTGIGHVSNQWTTPACPGPTAATADASANAATKALLGTIKGLAGKATDGLAVGQQVNAAGNSFAGFDELKAKGLATPKLMGADLEELLMAKQFGHYAQVLNRLVAHAQAGGWVTLSAHLKNPMTGGNMFDRSDIALTKVLPGGAKRAAWTAQLDAVAAILAELQTKGVPVLFRPFHEANQPSFWWGRTGDWSTDTTSAAYQQSSAAWVTNFKALWKDTFSYLTTTKGLHNLLFVYSSTARTWSGNDDPMRTWPGAGYVDVNGIDTYDRDCHKIAAEQPDVVEVQAGAFTPYQDMVATGKPFALTEVGAFAGTNGNWAATTISSAVKQKYPKTAYAMAWYDDGDATNCTADTYEGVKSISRMGNPAALLNDPLVLTL